MKKIHGTTTGLKPSQIRRLENFYRRRIPPQYLLTAEAARDLAELSHAIQRQVGLLVTRRGKISHVLLGDRQGIVIPATEEYRLAPGRLKGLRCVHTRLDEAGLSRDDLTDLVLLRLDIMATVAVSADGRAAEVHAAHVLPSATGPQAYVRLPPLVATRLDIGCLELIQALEAELHQGTAALRAQPSEERALLVSVSHRPRREALDSLAELRELAQSCGVAVTDSVLQQRRRANPRFLIGPGKLEQIALAALQQGAGMIVFDQELNPSQIRSITDAVALKVIDRTQLILDIFAQRAQSREGKLQVELAQLKYLQPRLVTKNTAMSRLTGGIGGRGPGETKLEINRRRVRERIRQLERSIEAVRRQRRQQKARRGKRELPVISIIGYTNAGKSTLLNSLTNSAVHAEDRLFATLDPTSRRLRFPRETHVIVTDTVGFIRDLPKELQTAFRATLEELENADLLVHLIDASNPRLAEQVTAVEAILADLELDALPMLRVLNKQDRVAPDELQRLCRRYDAIAVCAIQRPSLLPLLEAMEKKVQEALIPK